MARMARSESPSLSVMAAALALLVALAAPGAAAVGEGSAMETGLAFRATESDASHTVVEITVPEMSIEPAHVGAQDFDVARIRGVDPFGAPGEPLVGVAGTFIAIPPTGSVTLRVLEQQYETRAGLNLMPIQPDTREAGDPVFIEQAAYAADRLFPSESVSVGEPAIMRDLRVVPLRVYPIQYNPVSGEARVLRRLVVELVYTAEPGPNELSSEERGLSASFRPQYESLIANFSFLNGRYESDGRGRYVIITHDNYYSSILPLADWKHRRGIEVEIAKLSVIGSTAANIKAYLQNAFNNWQIRPDYVLLVGDTEQLPTGTGSTDDYYATLNGADYLVDVHLGRLSCDNVTQCDLIVAKTLGYEKTPYMGDLDWFKSGCLIVRDDYDPPDDAIYYADTWHAYNLMEAEGFAQIDTLFRKHGANTSHVYAAIADGRVFVNYRGQGVSNWWDPFAVDPNQTNPGYKLPVVMSATCGTGSFYSEGYPCETWMRAGTVAAPKGSVVFVATSKVAGGVAHLRSKVNQEFYNGIFSQKIREVGGALDYAKYRFYLAYTNQSEYQGWNTQGDPELDVWTGTAQTLTVTHPAAVPPTPSNILVEVRSGGSPIDRALVCAYAPGEVYSIAYTNTSGQATLAINPATSDTVWITVSGHNLYPYQGHAVVTPTGPYLAYADHAIDDSETGNDDGLVSPGETVELTVELENLGPDAAISVTGVLRSSDAYGAPGDSTANYGSIPAGQTRANTDPFSFTVADDCPNAHGLEFSLFASEAGRESWTIALPAITVSAGDLAHAATVIDDSGSGDGDGVLEAGETAWLTLTLRNDGAIALNDVTGVLSTADAYAAVTDANGAFGSIVGGGGTAQCSENPFRVSASPNAPPAHQISFTLAASGDGGTYQHEENVAVSVTIGGTATAGPCGPDAYGYYAYDTSDGWTGQAPVYGWVELVGVGTLMANITNADAAVQTVTLPFTFKYYGTNFTQVTVCSNGFLSMGVEDYRMGSNIGIPSTEEPDAMIAPLWDDLDPSAAGDIYQWTDTANHRYIVQFDAVPHYGGQNPETFEVIFLDPAYYPTTSGNGIILFQYQDPRAVTTATVGIESITETTGIQYEYNGAYDPAAATIVAGQAIKFTTEPPEAPDVWLVVDGSVVDDSATGNGNGVAEPGETVNLVVTLENRGTMTASPVSGTLTSSDLDVTVVDGSAAWPNIPSQETRDNAASPFVLTVGPIPDSEIVELDLHVSTGGRYDTWDVITIVLDLSQTGVEGPLAFALGQNSPNPFGRGTTIAFDLPAPAHARIDVYNAAGRRIATILDRDLAGGRHDVAWDGRDDAGNGVAAGVYFYRLEAGKNVGLEKMIIIR